MPLKPWRTSQFKPQGFLASAIGVCAHLQYLNWLESALVRTESVGQRSTQWLYLNPPLYNFLAVELGLDSPQSLTLSNTTFPFGFRRGKSKIGLQTCPSLQQGCSQPGPNPQLTGVQYPQPQSR
jgi:hypothetical protein